MRKIAENVPRPILFAVIFPLLALACYWWWAYAGAYKWIAEFQLRDNGSYSPVLTFLLTFLATVLPALVVLEILDRFGVFNPMKSPGNDRNRIDKWGEWASAHRNNLVFLSIGVGMFLFGAYQSLYGLFVSPLRQMSIERIEADDSLPSNWLKIEGRLLNPEAIAVFREGDRYKDYFIPLVSKNWKAGDPVAVFVSAREKNLDKFAFDTVQGMLDPQGLPGVVRAGFEEAGILVAPHYYVLEHRSNPGQKLLTGVVCMVVGAIIALVCAVILMARIRAERPGN